MRVKGAKSSYHSLHYITVVGPKTFISILFSFLPFLIKLNYLARCFQTVTKNKNKVVLAASEFQSFTQSRISESNYKRPPNWANRAKQEKQQKAEKEGEDGRSTTRRAAGN